MKKFRKTSKGLKPATDPFYKLFDKVKNELAESVLEALGVEGRAVWSLTGQAAPSVQHNRAYHIRRVDASIKAAFPKMYKLIDRESDNVYLTALNEARTLSELSAVSTVESLGDSRLYEPTIKLQRKLLDNELTAAFINSGKFAKRIINGPGLHPNQRALIQEAVTSGMIKGGGQKVIADEIFKALNRTGKFEKPIVDAITGKFIHINGRAYNLAKYSELIAHNRLAELENRSRINSYTEQGYNLIQIDAHNTTAEVCKPFEATIWSITGSYYGTYAPIEDCYNAGPPFHPRCSHRVFPVASSKVNLGYDIKRIETRNTGWNERYYNENEAVENARVRLNAKLKEAPTSFASVKYRDKYAKPKTIKDAVDQTITPKNVTQVSDLKNESDKFDPVENNQYFEDVRPTPWVKILVSDSDKKIPIKELRKNVVDVYDKTFKGKSFNQPEKGKINFTKEGRKKPIATSADPVKLYTMKHLDSLFEKSKFLITEPETKGRNIKAWHRFTANAVIDDVEYIVRLLAKEDDKGISYYNHRPKKMKP